MKYDRKQQIDKIATLLANTREVEIIEGEWAIRLYEEGVRVGEPTEYETTDF